MEQIVDKILNFTDKHPVWRYFLGIIIAILFLIFLIIFGNLWVSIFDVKHHFMSLI